MKNKWDAMILTVLIVMFIQPLRTMNPYIYWGVFLGFLWFAIWKVMNKWKTP